MNTNLKNKKGFTLVELMTVVAIIAILGAIAMPLYNNFRSKAAQSAVVHEAKEYMKGYQAAVGAGFTQFKYKGRDGTLINADVATFQEENFVYLSSDLTNNCTLDIKSTHIGGGIVTFQARVRFAPNTNDGPSNLRYCLDSFHENDTNDRRNAAGRKLGLTNLEADEGGTDYGKANFVGTGGGFGGAI